MRAKYGIAAACLLAAFTVLGAAAQEQVTVGAAAQEQVTVAAAQSLEASGFLGYIGLLAHAAGLDIQWMPAENDQVIQLGRECGADALLVSDPAGEEKLVRDGIGALRLRVMTAGLQEQFDAIALNPAACPAARLDPALKFLRWITSEQAQKAIADFSARGARYQPNAGSETCPTCESRQ